MARGGGTGAGRPKGAINKRSLEFIQELDAACKKHGVDLIGGTVILANHSNVEVQLKARKMLLEYAYPKMRTVDWSGDSENLPTFRLVIHKDELPADSVPPADPPPEPPE